MVSKLLHYLRPKFSTYHVRAVKLIWSLESSVKRPYVESILAQSLTSPESRNDIGAYEAFGVLWRLTGTCSTSKNGNFFWSLTLISEDNLLPGFRFKVPLMIVLDALKSDDPHLKRTGETWMRCSLRSYLRYVFWTFDHYPWGWANDVGFWILSCMSYSIQGYLGFQHRSRCMERKYKALRMRNHLINDISIISSRSCFPQYVLEARGL